MTPSTPPVLARLWRDDTGPVVDRAAALRYLADVDPALGHAIMRVGPLELNPPDIKAPHHYLQRAIVYQQLSGRAAETIYRRFAGLFPGRLPSAARILETPEATLRSAGLSSAKARAIIDLARHTESGTVPSRRALAGLDPEAVIERLTQIRGVGRWTVEMLLIFYLGHPDILPLSDLGIRKGFSRTFGVKRLASERTVARRAERWRPWRSIASWYLWRSLEVEM
ncbi:MAG: DNA-3-methyladenine glycosylase family protein [Gemmatimonadales bacterium]